MPTTSDLVRERLVAIRYALPHNLPTQAASIVRELPPVSEVSDHIPDHIRRLMNGTDGDEQVPGETPLAAGLWLREPSRRRGLWKVRAGSIIDDTIVERPAL